MDYQKKNISATLITILLSFFFFSFFGFLINAVHNAIHATDVPASPQRWWKNPRGHFLGYTYPSYWPVSRMAKLHIISSCSVVAGLIVTATFPKSISVPGGVNDAGSPFHKDQLAFNIFTISSYVSFYSSLLAVVLFLSVLTSSNYRSSLRNDLATNQTFVGFDCILRVYSFYCDIFLCWTFHHS